MRSALDFAHFTILLKDNVSKAYYTLDSSISYRALDNTFLVICAWTSHKEIRRLSVDNLIDTELTLKESVYS